jgi:NAD(P)H-hydrate epimerase
VDEGDTSLGKSGARPDTLVSLTAPKLGSKTFEGAHHFVGGRFLPPKLAAEYGLVLPEYEGANQCVRMPSER